MSTITVRYSPALQHEISVIQEQLITKIISATAQVLQVDPNGVIVELSPWIDTKPQNAPDILFRAETSVKRREHLNNWGKALLTAWQEAAQDLQLPTIRVAAKPYVLDSGWVELGK
jgi:hypothetical protein